MKKKVWLMNHYASHMLFEKGGRHYNFAKHLEKNGYSPVVFCGNTMGSNPNRLYFDNDKLMNIKVAEEIRTPFVFVKTRTYNGNGKKRILNMVDFYHNVQKAAKEYARINGKPDVIIASSVHPLTIYAGIKLAKFFGVECISEVRDLWPESIVSLKRINGLKRILIKYLYSFEKKLYKKSDKLIFTMEGAYEYIKNKGWERDIPKSKVEFINNGVDLEEFYKNRDNYRYKDVDLDNDKIFKVVYAGSLNLANDIDKLLDIGKKIINPNIKILIWGGGNYLEKLKERVEQEHIKNVVFKGRTEKKYIPSIVCKADLNFIHWSNVPVIQYGFSFNKMFEYFAAEKPIIMDVNSGYNPLEEFNAGYIVDNSSVDVIANKIEEIASLDYSELENKCFGARKAAEYYDFTNLTKILIALIEK